MQKIHPAAMRVLAVLVVLAVPAAVSAQDPVPITATPYVVKGGPGLQGEATIGGSIVALYHNPINLPRIYYVDLSVPGAVPQSIPINPEHWDSMPHTSGGVVVFARHGAHAVANDIMAFDVANPWAGPFVLSPDSTMRRWNPAVGGDTVAFQQWPTSTGVTQTDVCVSSLRDPAAPEICLTSDHLLNSMPSVSPDGNTVVWTKCGGGTGSCDIYMAERDTVSGTWGAPRLLADTGGRDIQPHTDGRLVTWRASDDTAADTRAHIYYMSIDGITPPTRVALTDGIVSEESNPHVSGNLISFDRTPLGGPRGVHLYDVATGTMYALPNEPGMQRFRSDMSHDTTTGQVRMVWTQQADGTDWNGEDVWAVDFTIAAAQYVVQPLFNQSRAYKQGSVVPIRLQVLDGSGTDVSSPSLALVATALVQTDSTADPLVVEDAGNANPDNAFRYDVTLPGYVFNLSTKTLSPGTWELRFTVGSDTGEYSVTFDVR